MRQPTVVIRPLADCTSRSPVLNSRKLPVPYVHFASPGEKQVCPNSAACWSPSAEATGTPSSGPRASP